MRCFAADEDKHQRSIFCQGSQPKVRLRLSYVLCDTYSSHWCPLLPRETRENLKKLCTEGKTPVLSIIDFVSRIDFGQTHLRRKRVRMYWFYCISETGVAKKIIRATKEIVNVVVQQYFGEHGLLKFIFRDLQSRCTWVFWRRILMTLFFRQTKSAEGYCDPTDSATFAPADLHRQRVRQPN